MAKVGRNDPCVCGSGKKYKRCCLLKAPAPGHETINLAWRKLRQTDDSLFGKLQAFIYEDYPECIQEAWEEFNCYGESSSRAEDAEPALFSAFIPYISFNWVPDIYRDELDDLIPCTLGEVFREEYPERLSPDESTLLWDNLLTVYSLYEVLDVNPGNSVQVKDIFDHKEYLVLESTASHTLSPGFLIYARVTQTKHCNIFTGMYPSVLPAQFLSHAVAFKQELPADVNRGDLSSLYEYEVREFFLDMLVEAEEGFSANLRNTDGEDLVPTKLIFNVHSPLEELIEPLGTLDIYFDYQDTLDRASYNDGKLERVEMKWLVEGNAVHSWDNTLIAHFILTKDKLHVHINSEERAERAKKEIARLLGDRVSYQNAVIESIPQQLNQAQMTSPPDHSLNLDEHPEIKKQIEAMISQHWKNWLDEDIPALNHQTPRQAAQSEQGRERLEALFSEFHYQNKKLEGNDAIGMRVDIAFLRKELGMDSCD